MKAAGADVAFNYKTENTREVLKKEGPIDMCAVCIRRVEFQSDIAPHRYWDNVAGPTLDDAIVNMAKHGLVIACGSISGYNGEPAPVKVHFKHSSLFQTCTS